MQTAPPLPPLPELPPVIAGNLPWVATLDPMAVVLLASVTLLVAGLVLWPLVRAIARRIEGAGGRAAQAELASLHERVAELEAAQSRLAELEERVDFSERLLARQDVRHLVERPDGPR